MKLDKLIKEEVSRLITEDIESEVVIALQSLVESMRTNGIEVLSEDVDKNNAKIIIDLGAKNKTSKYSVSLEIIYEIVKQGYKTNGRHGSVEVSEEPYSESPIWKMELEKGTLYQDGDDVYVGKEPFEGFFKTVYDYIHSFFDEKIGDEESYYNENSTQFGLKEFIQKELSALHKKVMLESERKKVIKKLRLLKEDEYFDASEGPQPGDANYHYSEPKLTSGVGNFDYVDWQVIHEILLENTNILKNKISSQATFGARDFYDDQYLTKEELGILMHDDLIYLWDGVPIIDDERFLDFDAFYNEAKRIWDKYNSEKKTSLNESSGLKLASGNPLDGKSRQSAINYIYKLFNQLDHGQRYKDDAWQNVHKVFNTFRDYNIDTNGGYDAEYNPGGINVGEMEPQWKKWKVDFNFVDNKGKSRILTFVLTAHAGGTIENPWSSYDITFYPIG